jgi:hypothetical protein
MQGVLSEKRGLQLTVAAGSRQCSLSWVQVPRDSLPYFTVSNLRPPNLEYQVPLFISPRNSVAQLYPQALDFELCPIKT